MDRQFFIKHYSLPIIQKMRELFIDNSGNLNYKFSYLNEGFAEESISGTQSLIFLFKVNIIPNKRFKGVYSDIKFQFIKNKNHINFKKFIKVENHNILDNIIEYYLPKYNDITQEYINFIHEIGIDKILREAVKELDDMKANFEKEIEKQNLVEDEFINMI